MADFVPDGHKYGWRFSKPWGAKYNQASDEHQILFSQLRFKIAVGGVTKTLGLHSFFTEGTGNARYAHNIMQSPLIIYYVLSYDTEGDTVSYTATELEESPVGKPLEVNQFLLRMTATATDSNYAWLEGGSGFKYDHPYGNPCLFVEHTAATAVQGIRFDLEPSGKKTEKYDFCFEFDAAKSPQVQSFSAYFENRTQSENPAPELAEESGLVLYADALEAPAVGACVYDPDNLHNPNSIKSVKVPQPSPMSCLYKDTSGALYQLDTSAYATQAEYQALLARVAALEAAKAGA